MTTTIRQCIKTRYVGPTDTKPGRVKATCERGSITIDWMHEGSVGENHRAAVAALLSKFASEDFAKYGEKSNGWGHMAEWRGGADKSEHVWVRVPGLGAMILGLEAALPYLHKMAADGADTAKPVEVMIAQIERTLQEAAK